MPLDPPPSNPMQELIAVARENLVIAKTHLPFDATGLPLAPWSNIFSSRPFPTTTEGKPLYDTVEFAGEAGLYEELAANPELDVLMTGTLAWQVRGIDAIARHRPTGCYVICEAKGTQSPIAESPLIYLRTTRHKGRQLSPEWCWKSLVDMADHPTTALAFMHLLEPLLHGRFERLLAVTQVVKRRRGYLATTRRIFPEAELAQYAPICKTYDLTRQLHMWEALPARLRKLLHAPPHRAQGLRPISLQPSPHPTDGASKP